MARTTEIPIHGIMTPVIQMDIPVENLETSIPAKQKGTPNGVATLNEEGKVPAEQLPEAPEIPKSAPAGFGLGNDFIVVTPETIDSTYKSGWYNYNGSGTKLNGINFDYATLRVDGNDPQNFTQFLMPVGFDNPYILTRKATFGVLGEWECDNPPMEVGIEYRTTERYMGKPVYVMNTGDLGSLSDSYYTAFSFYPSGVIDRNVSCTGEIWKDDTAVKHTIPGVYSDGQHQFVICGATNAGGIYVLSPNGGISDFARHCAFTVKFTKLAD